MKLRTANWLWVSLFALVVAMACSPSPEPPPTSPSSGSTPAGKTPEEYLALEEEIESAIRTGPAKLDSVRAVLVNVDGETRIAHYRHGFTESSYGHVFSVTKSVVAS